MSFLGLGGSGPTSAQKLQAAETELEMITDMFNRLQQSCTKKCIPSDYREGELNKGESVCLDRCVSKFFEINVKVCRGVGVVVVVGCAESGIGFRAYAECAGREAGWWWRSWRVPLRRVDGTRCGGVEKARGGMRNCRIWWGDVEAGFEWDAKGCTFPSYLCKHGGGDEVIQKPGGDVLETSVRAYAPLAMSIESDHRSPGVCKGIQGLSEELRVQQLISQPFRSTHHVNA